MSEQAGGFEREVRDTIVRSGLTGVAATVLAVTIFSPAGLGGMIGTSLASGAGHDPNGSADNPYANLPAYPSPLTPQEISDIRGTLASTAAAMEFTRAATDAKIEHIRALAMVDGAVTFTPMPTSNVPYLAAAPTPAAPVARQRAELSQPPAEETPIPVRVSYANGAPELVPVQVSHTDLADLLFAHEDL